MHGGKTIKPRRNHTKIYFILQNEIVNVRLQVGTSQATNVNWSKEFGKWSNLRTQLIFPQHFLIGSSSELT